MKKIFALLVTLFLVGCGPDPTQTMAIAPASEFTQDGISVVQVGIFKDELAYGHRRGVYRIKDQRTRKEYIGVSGIGISEVARHSNGKQSIEDER